VKRKAWSRIVKLRASLNLSPFPKGLNRWKKTQAARAQAEEMLIAMGLFCVCPNNSDECDFCYPRDDSGHCV
jgi:hypothetical protein